MDNSWFGVRRRWISAKEEIMNHRLAAAVAASILLASCGGYGSGSKYNTMMPPTMGAPSSMPAVTTTILGSSGLATPAGFTLYEFSADGSGVSNCNGPCASVWPPFMASAGAVATGNFTIITRSDGSHQWADKGHPLYTFSQDTQPGMATGNGVTAYGGTFTVARP